MKTKQEKILEKIIEYFRRHVEHIAMYDYRDFDDMEMYELKSIYRFYDDVKDLIYDVEKKDFKEEVLKKNDNETKYFDGIKTGDKVWSINFGWGEVEEVYLGNAYPIKVKFIHPKSKCTFTKSYNLDGFLIFEKNQTLFWDKVNIKPPKKPDSK